MRIGWIAAAAVLAAAGGAAWLLRAPGPGPGSGAGSPGEGDPALPGGSAPGPASAEEAAPPAPGGGRVEGILLRDGRPRAGVVTAYLADRGPPDPASFASWDAWWDRGSPLFAGLDPSPRGTATAGADGRWSMAGLPPGVIHFRAEAEGGLRGRGTEDVTPSGAALARADGSPAEPLRIHLEGTTSTLRGRLVLPGGAPWKGFAAVRLGSYEGEDPLPVPVDGAGRFEVEDLPAGSARLAALAPGVREIGGPAVLLPCPEEVTFVVGAGGIEVPGRVVDDGTGGPVGGALVRADYEGAEEPEEEGGEEVLADAEGRFRVRAVSPGGVSLQVEAEGYRTARTGSVSLPLPDPAGVVVRLRRPSSLSGRVLAAGSGAPVPGARVVLGDGGGDAVAETVAGSDGRYAFPSVDPGPATLRAMGNGWIPRSLTVPGVRLEEVLLSAGEAAERDLWVVPGPRVRGKVLDAEGRPAAGVRVLPDPQGRNGVPGELDTLARDLASPVETGPDGSFRIPALAPWVETLLVAEAGGIPLARAGPFVLEPGEEREADLRLPPERILDVRVEAGEVGLPVEGASVEVRASGQRILGRRRIARGTAPASGSLRLGPLPPGDLQVEAEAPAGGARGAAGVAAGVSGEVRVVLEGGPVPGARTVEIRVVLPDGAPATGASVEIRQEDAEGERTFGLSGEVADVRGMVRFEGVPPGAASVEASRAREGRIHSGTAEVGPGGTAAEVVLRPGEPADEDRPAAIRFAVTLVGPDDAPVHGAAVIVRARIDGEWEEEWVAARGGSAVATFDGPGPAETVLVEVSSAADPTGRPLPLGHGVFGPFDGRAGAARIRLAPEAAIEGRVLSPSGRGVEAVRVLAEPVYEDPGQAEDWSPPDAATAVTGPGGAFRLTRLGPGLFRLRASGWPAFAPAAPVDARGGATGVDLRLRPAVAPTLRVLDADGRPLEGASVEARVRGESSDGEAQVGPSGSVRLHGLDPEGEYTLALDPPPEREDLLPLRLRAWRPADGEFRLPRAHVLEVAVQDPDGRPLPGTVVEYLPEGGKGWRRRHSDDGGVARIEDLGAGRVQLRARLVEDKGMDGPKAEATAAAAAGRVALVLDPGLEARFTVPAGAVDVWLLEAGEFRATRYVGGDRGTIRIRGLREGATYLAYFRDRKTHRCAVLRGVTAGAEPREVVLGEGRTLEVRIILPEGARTEDAGILVDGADLIPPSDWSTERMIVPGIPPGRWTLRLVARLPGAPEPSVRLVQIGEGPLSPIEVGF